VLFRHLENRPDKEGNIVNTWLAGGSTGVVEVVREALASSPYVVDAPLITSPEQAAEVLVPMIADADKEICVLLSLDTKHRLISADIISVGNIDHTFMSPREIFRTALMNNASAVLMAHNHPSGDPEPSGDDEKVTRRIVRAGELVGIDVLDHLIIGHGNWVSLARRGVI
jgi:DNA repair protein RadC